jgi:hypothetical protein
MRMSKSKIILADVRAITGKRLNLAQESVGCVEAGNLTLIAPRGEGRWTGRMNPFHQSSSTRLGLGGYKMQDVNTGVGGWGNENGPRRGAWRQGEGMI